MSEMLLKLREWKCPGCNADHDSAINAAINIQHKGITELMAVDHVVKAYLGLRKSGSSQLQRKNLAAAVHKGSCHVSKLSHEDI